MKIRTEHDPKPIPDRQFDWSAIDESTYDGAEDSEERHMVGYGATEAEAIEDLLRIHRERAEAADDIVKIVRNVTGACPYTEAEIERSQERLARLFGFTEVNHD